jgi:hypothetical protein
LGFLIFLKNFRINNNNNNKDRDNYNDTDNDNDNKRDNDKDNNFTIDYNNDNKFFSFEKFIVNLIFKKNLKSEFYLNSLNKFLEICKLILININNIFPIDNNNNNNNNRKILEKIFQNFKIIEILKNNFYEVFTNNLR